MENYLLIAAIVSLLVGACFIGRYLYLDYKAKQQKSFTIIALGLLAFWFFGGTTLMIVGIVLFAFLFLRWVF